VRCLQLYDKKHPENKRPTISGEALDLILQENNSPEISTEVLEQKEIIKWDNENGLYIWIGGEYIRYLRKEIASTLWILIASEEANGC